MRYLTLSLLVGFGLLSTWACAAEEPPPAQYAPPPQQPYPQQPAPAAQQQQQFPQQPAPAPAPAPAPGAAPAGGLSTPDAAAFPCSSDAQCVTHRCNTQFGKCAWPCQTNNDCAPGNRCAAPLCVPGQ